MAGLHQAGRALQRIRLNQLYKGSLQGEKARTVFQIQAALKFYGDNEEQVGKSAPHQPNNHRRPSTAVSPPSPLTPAHTSLWTDLADGVFPFITLFPAFIRVHPATRRALDVCLDYARLEGLEEGAWCDIGDEEATTEEEDAVAGRTRDVYERAIAQLPPSDNTFPYFLDDPAWSNAAGSDTETSGSYCLLGLILRVFKVLVYYPAWKHP